MLVFIAEGKRAKDLFAHEAGGHRWQRVPPTEKRGRVHTSTVTVAVLDMPTDAQVTLNMRDVEISTCRGSGAGGQHRNVTDSAVQALHKPSGLRVRVESERSQHLNKSRSLALLQAKLEDRKREKTTRAYNSTRQSQIGSGMRGDKIRTVQVRHGKVTDHRTGKKIPYKQFRRGLLKGLN